MPYANNKGADQPAHPRSLISTFVVRCLDSMLCILALSKVSRFKLVSVAEQACLNLTWSKIPKTQFHVMWLTYQCQASNSKMQNILSQFYYVIGTVVLYSQRALELCKEQWSVIATASFRYTKDEPPHDKTNKMTMRQQRLRSAWTSTQSD